MPATADRAWSPKRSAPDPTAAIAAGLAVFPLPPGGRRPDPGWQARCTRNPADLHWRHGDNIGVGCRTSNVVGLDLDRHGGPDGIARFAALCTDRGEEWPDTLTVRTPSGGLHLYFRPADGTVIGSTSGGRSRLGPGIDTRGPGRRTGGYLIGPGSVVAGRTYTIERAVPVAPLPTWLVELLAAPHIPAGTFRPRSGIPT